MTNLTNLAIQSGYGDLLTTTNNGQGLINVLQQLQDGFGNASPITIATNAVNFNRQDGNTFQLDGVALTAPSANINSICTSNNFSYVGNLNALQLPILAFDPLFPTNGLIYYNNITNNLRAYVNGAWVILA